MSDGRTLRAVWSHWHNSQLSRGEEMYMKLQSPKKKRPERQPKRPQSDEKSKTHEREEAKRENDGKDPDWTKQSPIEV